MASTSRRCVGSGRPAPPGFDAFWHRRYAEALGIDPLPRLRQSPLGHPHWQVDEAVQFDRRLWDRRLADKAQDRPGGPQARRRARLWRARRARFRHSGQPDSGAVPVLSLAVALDIVLAIGVADAFLYNNRYLIRLLADKGISHDLHIWDGRADRAGA